MKEIYDVAIIGLGAMGSAAFYQLAQKGVKVIGIDQFNPPHDKGSSHGESRITRLSAGEGSVYTPIVKRSHEIWKEIEEEFDDKLFYQCGLLLIGERENTILKGSLDNAKKYKLSYEDLSNQELSKRWSNYFNIPQDNVGFYSDQDGLLIPEKCIEYQLKLGVKNGGTKKTNTKIVSINKTSGIYTIKRDDGEVYANKVIITAGSWAKTLLPEITPKVRIVRHVLYWFEVNKDFQHDLSPESFPVFNIEFGLDGEDGNYLYGFPVLDHGIGGVKISTENFGIETESADKLERVVSQKEIDRMYEYSSPYLPYLSDKCIAAKACMYTQTPDFDFIIDYITEDKSMVVASGFSGHGFKHSAGIGEILSEMIIDGETKYDITPFSIKRDIFKGSV